MFHCKTAMNSERQAWRQQENVCSPKKKKSGGLQHDFIPSVLSSWYLTRQSLVLNVYCSTASSHARLGLVVCWHRTICSQGRSAKKQMKKTTNPSLRHPRPSSGASTRGRLSSSWPLGRQAMTKTIGGNITTSNTNVISTHYYRALQGFFFSDI